MKLAGVSLSHPELQAAHIALGTYCDDKVLNILTYCLKLFIIFNLMSVGFHRHVKRCLFDYSTGKVPEFPMDAYILNS